MIHTRPLLCSLLLASATLSACGGGGGGSVLSTPPAPMASVSPMSLDFGLQIPGTPSAAKTITLRNTGNAALTLPSPSITLSGTDASNFTQTATTCANSLAASASCTISVTFTPATGGAKSASLSIASNAASSPTAVSLAGVGTGDNAVAVRIDSGPLPTTNPTANILYASITFCTPGSTTACRTVDHIQIDTGSNGLRVFKSALDGASPVVVPVAVTTGGSNNVFECVQYADGYTWGSVVTVDAQIGTRKIPNLAIQLTGATNYFGAVPAGCTSSYPNNENSVALFGANGILGIGNYLQDCGPGCAPTTPASPVPEGFYYQCPPSSACTAVLIALDQQIQNPVHLFGTDNNGVLLKLPSVMAPGATTLDGFVLFGVDTQPDNAVGMASWYGLVPNSATLTTVYLGKTMASSIIDSGSNAYFFDSTITVCSSVFAPGFYCPASSLAQTATIRGTNAASTSVAFTVDNTDSLFSNHPDYGVFPNLAGSNGNLPALQGTFDWGLPFFLGRPVFVLFEGSAGPSGSGVTGPALAF